MVRSLPNYMILFTTTRSIIGFTDIPTEICPERTLTARKWYATNWAMFIMENMPHSIRKRIFAYSPLFSLLKASDKPDNNKWRRRDRLLSQSHDRSWDKAD